MRVLSLRQPWLITIVRFRLRPKRHENRTWSTAYRGPVLLHASKGMTREEYYDVVDFVRRVDPDELELMPPFDQVQRGGIVGRARIVDCVDHSDSPWFFGPFAFVLDDVEEVPFIPCPGALGLFRPPKHVREIYGVP